MLVDTHCHLGDPRFDADRAAVVARARAQGIDHILIIADSGPTTARAVELARHFSLSASAGVHPHEASTWNPETAARVEAALAEPEVVAVGETGLDYHYHFSPPEAQRRAFAAQLEIAARHRLPVVVHAREADDDVSAMIREAGTPVVLHSFSAGPKVFDAGLEVGAYFSFSGMVTFKTWALTDHVGACPPDRLLVETDAPYLAPAPYRGRRNEPAFVRHVAARVAQLLGDPPEAIATRTTTNAVRCFGGRLTLGAHPTP